MRTMVAGYKKLKAKIEAMEEKYDEQFQAVFTAIKALINIEEKPKRKIGFKIERQPHYATSESTLSTRPHLAYHSPMS